MTRTTVLLMAVAWFLSSVHSGLEVVEGRVVFLLICRSSCCRGEHADMKSDCEHQYLQRSDTPLTHPLSLVSPGGRTPKLKRAL